MNIILIIITLFIIFSVNLMIKTKPINEGLNEQVGRFCYTCSNKNYNDCLSCFNCGYCFDEFGNRQCIGGDYRGPYNFEKCGIWKSGKSKCNIWKSGDPYSYMIQDNLKNLFDGCDKTKNYNKITH